MDFDEFEKELNKDIKDSKKMVIIGWLLGLAIVSGTFLFTAWVIYELLYFFKVL